MNQKIKDAIADVINGLNVDEFGMSYTFYPSEVIASIAAAIAPLVEAGEPEADIKVDRDELYTEKFKEWREKYFKQQSNERRFISKSNGVLYDDFGLEQKFKRAYDESAIK